MDKENHSDLLDLCRVNLIDERSGDKSEDDQKAIEWKRRRLMRRVIDQIDPVEEDGVDEKKALVRSIPADGVDVLAWIDDRSLALPKMSAGAVDADGKLFCYDGDDSGCVAPWPCWKRVAQGEE